jgi:hypothetical protein
MGRKDDLKQMFYGQHISPLPAVLKWRRGEATRHERQLRERSETQSFQAIGGSRIEDAPYLPPGVYESRQASG